MISLRDFAALAAVSLVLVGCNQGFAEENPDLAPEDLVLLPEDLPVQAEPNTIILAEEALKEGRLQDAEVLLERYWLTFPDDPRGLLGVAELRLARGNTGGALKAFEDLLQYPEIEVDARQGYGIVLMLVGDEEKAVEELKAAVEADATRWRAWNALGAFYDSQGAWPEATDAYQRALALQPEEPIIVNNLGFSLLMQGRTDAAVRTLQDALRLDPTSELTKTNLRIAYAQLGQYRRAVAGAASDNEKARALNNAGYVALLRGDYDSAEAYFQQAMREDPSFNETAWRNLNFLESLRTPEDETNGDNSGAAATQ